MNRRLLIAALSALPLLANAAESAKYISNPYYWDVDGNLTEQNGSVITPYQPDKTLVASGLTVTFTAHPPRGQRVMWWSWGEKVNSTSYFNGTSWSESSAVRQEMGHSATISFTGDSAGPVIGVGCRFEYFPFSVELYKSETAGDHLTMAGPYYYTNSFTLVQNTYSRPGYQFAGWTNSVGTVFADQATVSGETLGVMWDPVVRLYAKWTANGYAVKFDGNGATGGSMADQAFTYDKEQALTANAFTRSYVVSFDGNGGTAGTSSATAVAQFNGWAETADGSVAYQDKAVVKNLAESGSVNLYAKWTLGSVTLPSASRSGSAFAGWYTAASGGTRVGGSGDMYQPTEPVTLHAQWIRTSVTVTFDANGGTTPIASKNVERNAKYGELPTPTWNDRHRFLGWYTAREDGDLVTANTTVTLTDDATLYAHWIERFAVTFEYRDATGDWIVPPPQFVDAGAAATLPTGYNLAPGYTFLKWSEDCQEITQDTYVLAVYDTNHYYLYFEPNATGVSGEMDRLDCAYDESYVLGNGFSRVGYVLREWNTKADGTGTGYAVGASVKKLSATRWERVYLYAQWAPISYTVSFDANGGEGTMTSLSLKYDEAKALPANAFTKGESIFRYWSQSGQTYDDGVVVSNLTDVADSTVILTAIWKEAYWVDYAANGGEGTMPRQTFYVGETGTLATVAFTRLGCTFAGWRTNDLQTTDFFTNCATVVDLAAAGETNTLTAVWSNNAYSVKFYPNGGEGEMPDQPLHCHEPQELVSNAFTRVNGTFHGWALDPAAAEPDYADGQEVTNLTYTTNATVRLYALWERQTPSTPSELAVALDCPLLDVSTNYSGNVQRWSVVTDASGDLPGPNGQFVRTLRPNGTSIRDQAKMTCVLPRGTGTFSFYYRTQVDMSESLRGDCSFQVGPTTLFRTSDNIFAWTRFEYEKTSDEEETATWLFTKGAGNVDDSFDIDFVTWQADDPDLPTVGITFRLNDGTPAPDDIWDNLTVSSGVKFTAWPVDPTSSTGKRFQGWFTAMEGGQLVTAESEAPVMDTTYYAQWGGGFPVPGPDDAVEASAVTVSGGAFGVSFTANPDFAYYLLATDALVPADWQRILGPMNGSGTQTFAPPIDAQHPQRFFKIETVQREE